MKTLILLIALGTLLLATKWNYGVLQDRGYKVTLICKNHILTEVIEGNENGIHSRIESPKCIDVSGWSGNCNHKPLSCKPDKEETE